MKPNTRKTANKKAEAVMANAVETEVVKAPVKANAVETEVETEVVETPVETEVETEVVESVKTILNELDVDQLKTVIGYCNERINELQKADIEKLEAEMRAIQEKLLAMRGYHKPVNGSLTTPIVNPNNPNEIYHMGKQPDWLKALMAETGKSVRELREGA